MSKCRSNYRAGCRCHQCRAQERDRQRAYRARRKDGTPSQQVNGRTGPTEQAVARECAQYADRSPGRVANALALARLLDDATQTPLHARAALALDNILVKLGARQAKRSQPMSRVGGGESERDRRRSKLDDILAGQEA